MIHVTARRFTRTLTCKCADGKVRSTEYTGLGCRCPSCDARVFFRSKYTNLSVSCTCGFAFYVHDPVQR